MIRRRSDSSYILITQQQHARLAAEIALHLGGSLQPPSRPADLASALRFHAAGFADLDANPPLCPSGRPANFDELSLSTLLDAWSRSAEIALAQGPYPGMMVSLLCLSRTHVIAASAHSLRDNFQVNKVQHRQVEIQQQLRPQLQLRDDIPLQFGLPDRATQLTDAESTFYYEFRLMLLCISLALELCARRSVIGHLAATPPSPAADSQEIRFHMISPTLCHLDPLPLAAPLTLSITGRRVPTHLYDHERELSEALAQAEKVTLDVVCDAKEPGA